jgi:Resolvase, N terminal domain
MARSGLSSRNGIPASPTTIRPRPLAPRQHETPDILMLSHVRRRPFAVHETPEILMLPYERSGRVRLATPRLCRKPFENRPSPARSTRGFPGWQKHMQKPIAFGMVSCHYSPIETGYGDMAKAKRAAIYLRVSTDDQTVENQRRELTAAATARGWTVLAEYADEGISGAKGRDGRPQLDLC